MRLDSDIIKARYNRNVELYNNDDNRIKEEILNILSSNEDRIRQRLEELKINVLEDIEFFKAEIEAIVLYNLYAPIEEPIVDPYQDQKGIDLMNQIFEQLKFEVESHCYIDRPEMVYQQLSDKIDELYSHKGLADQMSKPTTQIRNLISTGKKIRRIESELTAYEAVIDKIIDGLFPEKLERYGELSDSQRKDLESSKKGSGRNPDDTLTLQLVKDVVDECIKDKESKRFIHQEGNDKGKPNKRQIALHVCEIYPELVDGFGKNCNSGVSFKTVKRRVNNALSMNEDRT